MSQRGSTARLAAAGMVLALGCSTRPESPAPPPPSRPAPSHGAAIPSSESETAPAFALVGRRNETAAPGAMKFFRGADGEAFLASGPLLYRLGNAKIEHEASWVRGIEFSDPSAGATESTVWWNPIGLAGTWPNLFFLVELNGDEPVPPFLYRTAGDGWSGPLRDPKMGAPIALAPWQGGGVLVLESSDIEAAHQGGDRFRVVGANVAAPELPVGFAVAFDARPSGEVVAVLRRNEAFLVWRRASSGQVLPLSAPPGLEDAFLRHPQVVLAVDGTAWLSGRRELESSGGGYVARLAADVWKEIPTECDGLVRTIAPDTSGGGVYICDSGDSTTVVQWTETDGAVPLDGAPPRSRFVTRAGSGQLWILAGDDVDPGELWTQTTRPAPVVVLPDTRDAMRASLEWADPHPVTADCPRVWVPVDSPKNDDALETHLDPLDHLLQPQLRTCLVQGKTQRGVALYHTLDPPGPIERVERLRTRLGDAAGQPTCNERPEVEP